MNEFDQLQAQFKQLQEEIATLDFEIETVVEPIYVRRDELQERIEALFHAKGRTHPIGHSWQAEDSTVFEIVELPGKYVRFERVGWARTRRGYLGERSASMSAKRAEELGYSLGDNYDFVEKEKAE